MYLREEKIKGQIKALADKNNADARILLRIYMMERFLERLSISKYKDHFIIKGGILVSSMIGVSLRSTLDIDMSIKNYTLSDNEIMLILNDLFNIKINDGVKFNVISINQIMDEMEYPGIRISIEAIFNKILVPFKIDISTGDAVTPKEIEYKYSLLLESRDISLWSYNIETILAEKIDTIIYKSVLNTRMRDFYDIYILKIKYDKIINYDIFKKAFISTTSNRNHYYDMNKINEIISNVENSKDVINLWNIYRKKYYYAADIEYKNIIKCIRSLIEKI